jgi:ribosome biogenesis GTPase
MSVALAALGWDDRLRDAFQPFRQDGLMPARVSLEHTHIYRVMTEDGELLARVAGRIRHHATGRTDFPAVGDWVAIEPPTHGGDARIVGILPRRSRFSRRAAGDPTEEQIVAANIDTVFLVAGLDNDFNLKRIERYLLVAFESGASPVVVLNKADLVEDPQGRADEVAARAIGVPIHPVTTRRPESLEALRAYLGFGKTAALLGSSGVGKSTIVNRLIGHDLMRTRDVREADSRGRHTSSNRQLVLLPEGGILIDTPGMRELQLWDSGDAFAQTFTDIDAFAAECRFRDCSHRREPGCAVRAAVDAGDLPQERYDSFLKLAAEQEHQARQQDQRALLEQKRKWKVISKAANKHIKDKRGDT